MVNLVNMGVWILKVYSWTYVSSSLTIRWQQRIVVYMMVICNKKIAI